MRTIPHRNRADDLSLSHLRVLRLLLQERSLTRAAGALDTSQPVLSKILAKLRRSFHDPLFVRVGLSMEPTARALEMAKGINEILDAAHALQAAPPPFNPRDSDRTFNIFISDGGAILLLPPLMVRLAAEAPFLRLRAVPLEAQKFVSKLESGAVDLAVGAFPALVQGIRRRRLYAEGYLSVVHKAHPECDRLHSRKAFAAQRHVFLTTSDTGHAGIQVAERLLEGVIPPKNIALRVSSFTAAAMVAKQTKAIATMPAKLASLLASELDLHVFEPPFELPRIEIAQYWHERYDRDPCNRWIRSLFVEIFHP